MTVEQTRLIEDFNSQSERFININPTFFYKESFGQFSLKNELEPFFNGIQEKIEKTKSVIRELPTETIAIVNDILLEINNYLMEVSTYSQDKFVNQRFEILNNISVKYNKFQNIWERIAGLYLDIKLKDQEQLVKDKQQLEELINSLKEKSANDALEIEKLKIELGERLKSFEERYSEVYSKAELNKQRRRFLETADLSNSQAKGWFNWIIFLSLLLVGFAAYFFFSCWIDVSCVNKVPVSKDNERWLLIYELAGKTFLKILVLSIIIFLLKFSVRNYNALMHNFVINRHKENSLDAALNLMYNLPAGVGRDEVINSASKEIFTQHKTGFLNKEDDIVSIPLLEKIISIFAKGKE